MASSQFFAASGEVTGAAGETYGEDESAAAAAGGTGVIKRKNRTLLMMDKNARRVPNSNLGGTGVSAGSQMLDKIPEGSFKKKGQQTNRSTLGGSKTQTKGAAETGLKNEQMAKLSEDELAFLMDYRKLEALEREKGIKFFECVGDPPMTEAFQKDIEQYRSNFVDKKAVETR